MPRRRVEGYRPRRGAEAFSMSKLVILVAILAAVALIVALVMGGLKSPDGEAEPGAGSSPELEKVVP